MKIFEFLGLREVGDGYQMDVVRSHCGGRDSIYGGCGLAAAIEVAERQTGRPTVWASCHFLGPARLGETVRYECVELARGRAISHVRVRALVGDKECFSTSLALGERTFPYEKTWDEMPSVPGPEGLPHRYILASNKGGFRDFIEERAVTDDPQGIMRNPDGKAAVWIKMPYPVPPSASALALLGDEVSTGTSASIEPDMQAPSIDNTLRIVTPRECDWVLADISLQAAGSGFAHGTVNLWSPDGTLLGIATQTGVLRVRGT